MEPYTHSDTYIAGAAEYFDELPLWSAPFGLKLLERIGYRRNLTALDIGFGTGFPLTELAMRLGGTATVYGIDPWKDAVERARRKITQFGIANIRILDGAAEALPLADTSIDLIVSNNGINNVSDINKVISECSRVTRPGGQFVLTMNLDQSMFEFYREMECVFADLQMEHEIGLMRRHIYEKRRPLHEILALLEHHQFAVRTAEQDQFNLRFSDGTAMLDHHFIRIAFMDSWMKLCPEGAAPRIFSAIESRLNERSARLGGLTLSIPYVVIDAVRT